LIASWPRRAWRLPAMWTKTNPTNTMPVRAIIYFLIKEDCMTNLLYRDIFFPHKCKTREKAARMEV
jgi:hypothetical protein